MTCLYHFDTLIEFDAHAVDPHHPRAEHGHPATAADLSELAQLLASILRLAESVRTPWRPQTMEQWLT
jgi:hypothetical protein